MCFWFFLFVLSPCSTSFQIAYKTASTKFPGKLSELFLVLSDDSPLVGQPPASSAAGASHPPGRGHKHRLDDDQISVQSSGSKRKDLTSSADKNKGRNGTKNKPKNKPKN